MEAPSSEVNTIAATTNNIVVKGKRTKRQRVQSTIPFTLTTNSSSEDEDDNDGDDVTINSSSQQLQRMITTTEEEDEDMANCLILLAQGQCKESPKQDDNNNDHDIVSVVGFYHPIITNNNNNNIKFNSRKFMESGSGKAGYYVYECKTCNRTFPSFQALGGHRASHKKPKVINNNIIGDYQNDNNKKHIGIIPFDEEDVHYYRDVSSLSLQLPSNNNTNNSTINKAINNNKTKIHECAICGAEFSSGQALGGHMRRHRGPIRTGNTTLSLTTMARIQSEEQPKKERNLISLDLDLNLPAPDDENLPFASRQQQPQQQEQQLKPSLVFSGPALVGCQY